MAEESDNFLSEDPVKLLQLFPVREIESFDFPLEKLEKLHEDLRCTICRYLMNNPVYLRCSHRFCKECIEKHIRLQEKKSCPNCRGELSTKRDLRPDFPLISLISFAFGKAQEFTQKLQQADDELIENMVFVRTKSSIEGKLKRQRSEDQDASLVSHQKQPNKRRRILPTPNIQKTTSTFLPKLESIFQNNVQCVSPQQNFPQKPLKTLSRSPSSKSKKSKKNAKKNQVIIISQQSIEHSNVNSQVFHFKDQQICSQDRKRQEFNIKESSTIQVPLKDKQGSQDFKQQAKFSHNKNSWENKSNQFEILQKQSPNGHKLDQSFFQPFCQIKNQKKPEHQVTFESQNDTRLFSQSLPTFAQPTNSINPENSQMFTESIEQPQNFQFSEKKNSQAKEKQIDTELLEAKAILQAQFGSSYMRQLIQKSEVLCSISMKLKRKQINNLTPILHQNIITLSLNVQLQDIRKLISSKFNLNQNFCVHLFLKHKHISHNQNKRQRQDKLEYHQINDYKATISDLLESRLLQYRGVEISSMKNLFQTHSAEKTHGKNIKNLQNIYYCIS